MEVGSQRVRSDIIAAIGGLGSGFAELRFLIGNVERAAAEIQESQDAQASQLRVMIEKLDWVAAEARLTREEMSIRRLRPGLPGAVSAGVDSRMEACPYRGLLPFGEADADLFYGRERLIAELGVELTRRLSSAGPVVVTGASGAGKSSLLRAGLLPALAKGIQLKGSQRWPRMVITPTRHPLMELATVLAVMAGRDSADVREELRQHPEQAHLIARQAVLADAARRGSELSAPGAEDERLVLIVDQFEQAFTLSTGQDAEADRRAFITALCTVASSPAGPVDHPPALVLIAVRGDFCDRCAAHPDLARALGVGPFVVGPMTDSDLRRAITGPASVAGLQVDPDLVSTILADLRTAGDPEISGTLPLLSQAMLLTWKNREGDRLTVRGYGQTGGVGQVVQASADAVFDALPAAQRALVPEILRAMVVAERTGRFTRRPVTRSELEAGRRQADSALVDAVLEAFAAERLVVLDGGNAQISHDALLEAWPRLRGWLEEDQASWVLYGQLAEDATAWRSNNADASFLYRGAQLATVEQAATTWAASPARYPVLSGTERGFLRASQRSAARSSRQRRALAVFLILLLAASLTGGVAAVAAARKADQQRNIAISSQLAAQSEALDIADPVLAAQLAVAAWHIAPTSQARESMRDAFAQPDRAVLKTDPESGGLKFAPDGKTLAVLSDFTVQFWNIATRRQTGPPILADRTGDLSRVAFSPDGKLLATNGYNGTVRLWNVATRDLTGPPINVVRNSADDGRVVDLAFSPDGKLLATSGSDGRVRLWNVATRRPTGPPLHVPGAAMGIGAVSFSPNGNLLATAGGDGRVRLWNVTTHDQAGPPIEVASASVGLFSAVFSPDGRLVATQSGNGTVQLWDATTRHKTSPPISVISAAGGPGLFSFSPGGTFLATAGGDGIRLWNVDTGRQAGPPMAVGGEGVDHMTFSPDGKLLAAIGGDATVRLLDVGEFQQAGEAIDVGAAGSQGIALSADGRLIAAARGDGIIRLRNVTTRHQVSVRVPPSLDRRFPLDMVFSSDHKILAIEAQSGLMVLDVSRRRRIFYHTGSEYIAAVLSPNGKVLAFNLISAANCRCGKGDTTQLWDLAAGRMIRVIISYDHPVMVRALSTDGKILATTDNDGTIRLWKIATGRQIGQTIPVVSTLSEVAFSPDGSLLATVGGDGTVRLWDVATQRQVGPTMNASTVRGVNAVAFTRDGSLLATAGGDGMVRLWDVATQRQVGPTMNASTAGGVNAVAFTPDAKLLATLGHDKTVRLWNVTFPSRLEEAMCSIAGHSLTRSEWAAYIPSEPYHRSC